MPELASDVPGGCTRIGQEVALALGPQAERRRKRRMAHDGKMVQRVMDAKRKADYQQRGADGTLVRRSGQMLQSERAVDRPGGEYSAFDLDDRNIDLSSGVEAPTPGIRVVGVVPPAVPSNARLSVIPFGIAPMTGIGFADRSVRLVHGRPLDDRLLTSKAQGSRSS